MVGRSLTIRVPPRRTKLSRADVVDRILGRPLGTSKKLAELHAKGVPTVASPTAATRRRAKARHELDAAIQRAFYELVVTDRLAAILDVPPERVEQHMAGLSTRAMWLRFELNEWHRARQRAQQIKRETRPSKKPREPYDPGLHRGLIKLERAALAHVQATEGKARRDAEVRLAEVRALFRFEPGGQETPWRQWAHDVHGILERIAGRGLKRRTRNGIAYGPGIDALVALAEPFIPANAKRLGSDAIGELMRDRPTRERPKRRHSR